MRTDHSKGETMASLEQRYNELAAAVKDLGHAPDADRLRELRELHQRLDAEHERILFTLDPYRSRALRRLSAAIGDYLAAAEERDRQEHAAARARFERELHDILHPTITSPKRSALADHRDRSIREMWNRGHDRGYSR